MAPDKLTRAAVLERALKLADTEGLEAVTIRRLAQELGVTPMAMYWHFKSKEQLLVGMLDVVFGGVTVAIDPDEPWNRRLRVMVEALTRELRSHPWVPTVSQTVDKQQSESFLRTTNVALDVLAEGGFPLVQAFAVASYLLQGVTGLVMSEPTGPRGLTPEEAAEWRRCHRLDLESLPADRFPRLVEYARTLESEPDLESYYTYGLDLLLAGVEAMAARHGPR